MKRKPLRKVIEVPWVFVYDDDESSYRVQTDREGTGLKRLDEYEPVCFGIRSAETATLIAAAPDLLRELKRLLSAFTCADSTAADGTHAKAAFAALAKAEGRKAVRS
jgi:hypothetical protein